MTMSIHRMIPCLLGLMLNSILILFSHFGWAQIPTSQTATDLPPENTASLFDQILASNSSVPYPFANLKSHILNSVPGATVREVLIPHGRSLRKDAANTNFPRIVLSFGSDPSKPGGPLEPGLEGKLFLGFTEGADEIEVISYNEGAGRFEYQIVRDYKQGSQPRVVYPKRDVCLACHQSGGPLFSVRPWAETTANNEVTQVLAKAHPSKVYHGTPLTASLDAVQDLDDATDSGDVLLFAQKYWMQSCGHPGTECRRELMKAVLKKLWRASDLPQANSSEEQFLLALQTSFPAEGISQPSNDLLSRSPFAPLSLKDLREICGFDLECFYFGGRSKPPSKGSMVDPLSTQPLPPRMDPLQTRPPKLVATINQGEGLRLGLVSIATLFTEDMARFILTPPPGAPLQTGLESALNALEDPQFDSLFSIRPLNPREFIETLSRVLGRPQPEWLFRLDEVKQPQPDQMVPDLAISEGSPLKSFDQYCFRCHRGVVNGNFYFMSGTTEEEVKGNLKGLSFLISDRLDYKTHFKSAREGKLMPPPNSPEGISFRKLNVDQRDDILKKMIKYIDPF